MGDGLFVVVFVRWSSASPDGAADAVFREVVFITVLDAATAAAIQNCAEFRITLLFAVLLDCVCVVTDKIGMECVVVVGASQHVASGVWCARGL